MPELFIMPELAEVEDPETLRPAPQDIQGPSGILLARAHGSRGDGEINTGRLGQGGDEGPS